MSEKKYKNSTSQTNEVNEPAVAYGLSVNLYGGLFSRSAGHFEPQSDFDILTSSRMGLPKHSLMSLAKKISLSFSPGKNRRFSSIMIS